MAEDHAVLREQFAVAEITRRNVLVRQELLEMPDWEDPVVQVEGVPGQRPQHLCVTPTPVVRMRSVTPALTTPATLGLSALARELNTAV